MLYWLNGARTRLCTLLYAFDKHKICDFTFLNGRARSKNVNGCWKTKITFSLETSRGQSCSLYLNVVHFLNTRVNWTFVAA